MSGLFGDDTLTLYLKLKEAMKQYVRDAMPGGALNAEVPNYPQMIANQAQTQQDTLRDAWGDPNKMADATLGMMNGAMGSFLPFGITAWHGSPHKFDRFDLSKIGTGEGAQAYGHGSYLAETPEVAKGYAVKLSNVDSSGYANAQLNAQNLLQRFGNDKDWAKEVVKDQLNAIDKADPNFSRLTATLDVLDGKAPKQLGSTGYLYKIDIPDEAVARFLDWDKPLSQQAKEVQAALGKYVDTDKVKILDLIRKGEQPDGFGVVKSGNGYAPIIGGEVVGNGAKDLVFRSQDEAISYIANRIPATDPTAASIYRRMVGDHGGSDGISQAQVSGLLRQQGIPGIRYLDGGSRGAGTGTSNFVVFDPEMIRILERNGVATGAKPWQPGEWEGLFKK